jgi:ElaB/YqjD/DUF883 family membrane-anchored ribosome-binding protein
MKGGSTDKSKLRLSNGLFGGIARERGVSPVSRSVEGEHANGRRALRTPASGLHRHRVARVEPPERCFLRGDYEDHAPGFDAHQCRYARLVSGLRRALPKEKLMSNAVTELSREVTDAVEHAITQLRRELERTADHAQDNLAKSAFALAESAQALLDNATEQSKAAASATVDKVKAHPLATAAIALAAATLAALAMRRVH